MTASILFYVQHLLGVGHLARASLVALSLKRAGCRVRLVTGGPQVVGLSELSVDVLPLPPVRSAEGFSGLLTLDGAPADEAFRTKRRDLLLEHFEREKPDVLLIEAYPFGRRQMRFELDPLLDAARAAPWRPLVACSIRDILQRRRRPGRVAETVATLKRAFDLVLVHGDPGFMPLEETFPATDEIRSLLRYTGIVVGPVPPLRGPRYDIVVSAGGGAAGAALMRAAREALARSKRPDLSWCFLTGPNLAEKLGEELFSDLPANAVAAPFRSDFRALLAQAKLSVSQCGYNTAADILQAGCPAVLVPFATGGETEQTDRARALEARGVACVLQED
ncbi:MAG: glycosyltransferase family protein, partial [Parvibaculaceae bacterium]